MIIIKFLTISIYDFFSCKTIFFLCFVFMAAKYLRLKNLSSKKNADLIDRIKVLNYNKRTLEENIEIEKRKLAKVEKTEHEIKEENTKLKNKIEELDEEISRLIINRNKSHSSIDCSEHIDDITAILEEASCGKKKMTEKDWTSLQNIIYNLHPYLKLHIALMPEKLSCQQLHVCWLMGLGLSNAQIQNITDIPKTTVWRWTRKYEWVKNYEDDANIFTISSKTTFFSEGKDENVCDITTRC